MHQIGRVREHGSHKQPDWHLVEEREHQSTRRGNPIAKRPQKGRFPRCGSGKGKPADELSFGKPNLIASNIRKGRVGKSNATNRIMKPSDTQKIRVALNTYFKNFWKDTSPDRFELRQRVKKSKVRSFTNKKLGKVRNIPKTREFNFPHLFKGLKNA